MSNIPSLEYPEIARVLSDASGKQIPVSAFGRLESPVGDTDNQVNLVDGALVGYSQAGGSSRYFVECTLTLRSSPIDKLVSQRAVFDNTPPREVVKEALCQLVHLVQNPNAGHRHYTERWFFNPQ